MDRRKAFEVNDLLEQIAVAMRRAADGLGRLQAIVAEGQPGAEQPSARAKASAGKPSN
jgi:hypothetical protein